MVAAHVGHLLAAVWHLSSGAPCLVINASHCQAAQDAHHADHRQNHHHHRNPPWSAPLLTSACGVKWGGDSYRARTVLMKLSRRNRHLRRTLGRKLIQKYGFCVLSTVFRSVLSWLAYIFAWHFE